MNLKVIIGIIIPIFFILSTVFYTKNIMNFTQSIIGKLIFICIILFYSEINLKCGFLSLVFIVFFYKIFVDNTIIDKEVIVTKSREDTNENNIVPLIIYQTWHSTILPPKMNDCVERLKLDNPSFEHHLYNDNSCRMFIKNNYDKYVLNAYDQLVPGAYKADLWRYCVLYKTGGIYLDIKFQCEPGFSLIEFTKDKQTFILDRPYGDISIPLEVNLSIINSPKFYDNLSQYTADRIWNNKQIGLYNAIIASVPNNPVMYKCIEQIVKNVKNKKYGYSELYPTGPGLLGEIYFTDKYTSKVKEINYFNSIQGTYIINKNKKILSQYPEYRIEQRIYNNNNKEFYYNELWHKKKIYKIE